MSDKALTFDDFVLDDYDYDLWENWDLEYLWEWVELDDFYDLSYKSYNKPSKSSPPPVYKPPSPPPQVNEQERSLNSNQNTNDLDNFDFDDDILDQGGGGGSNQEEDGDEDDFDFDFDDVDSDNVDNNISDVLNEQGMKNDSSLPDISSFDNINGDLSSNNLDDITQFDSGNFNFEDIDKNIDDIEKSDNNLLYDQDHSTNFSLPDENDLDLNFDNIDLNSTYNSEFKEEDYDIDLSSSKDKVDHNSDDSFDFDLNDEEDDGFGSGGFDNNEETQGEKRYIETSAGTVDLEEDDILRCMQRVDFDEFLEVTHKYPYVYDKIMSCGKYPQEEMEFLKSIEPLVRDPDKIAEINAQKQNNDTEEKEDTIETESTLTFESAKKMYQFLCDKILEQVQYNKFRARVLPKDLRGNTDNEEKQSGRVGKSFHFKINKKNPYQSPVTDGYNIDHDIPAIRNKTKRNYEELIHIVTNEIKAMCGGLPPESVDFIKEEGERFGTQFMDFLLKKYGTKILFMYQSQMKHDVLADRMFEQFSVTFDEQLEVDNSYEYTQDFFRAVISSLQKNNISF